MVLLRIQLAPFAISSKSRRHCWQLVKGRKSSSSVVLGLAGRWVIQSTGTRTGLKQLPAFSQWHHSRTKLSHAVDGVEPSCQQAPMHAARGATVTVALNP